MNDNKDPFLFVGDIKLIEIISQANQSNIAKNFLAEKNFKISFSIFENPENADNLVSTKKRIAEEKNIKGIVFFSLIQLCYLGSLDLKLLDSIVNKKLQIIFIRENIIFKSKKEFTNAKKELSLFINNNHRIINKFYSLGI